MYGFSFGAMTFNLEGQGQGQMDVLLKYFEIMRDGGSICIVDLDEIIYGLSVGALDQEQRPKMCFRKYYSISKTMRYRDFICIVHLSHMGFHLVK